GTGRTREAIDEVSKALAIQPASDDAHRLLGRIFVETGQLDKGVTEFNAAIALRPGYWENYHALGLACFEKGRFDQAIAAFTRETELRPDSAVPLQALGSSYHAIGALNRALENYQHAITIAPNALAYSNIGLIHYSHHQYQEAVAAYRKSVELRPSDAVTHRNLADSLQKAGDYKLARESYEQSIHLAESQLRVNPKNAKMLTIEALCEAKLGRTQSAAVHTTSALEIASNDSEVLFQAAEVATILHRFDEAVELARQAIDHGYSRDLIAKDEDLQPLKARPDFEVLTRATRHP